MLTINKVTLRFLEFDDIDTLYSWESDIELSIWSGWTSPFSRAAFRNKYEQRITEPEKDLVMLGIEFEGRLVGYVQLAMIDHYEQRAAVHLSDILFPKRRSLRGSVGLLEFVYQWNRCQRYLNRKGGNQRDQEIGHGQSPGEPSGSPASAFHGLNLQASDNLHKGSASPVYHVNVASSSDAYLTSQLETSPASALPSLSFQYSISALAC